MKKILLALLVLLNASCMDTKQSRAKRGCPPEKFFGAKDLVMAKAIYKDDSKTIEYLVKQEHYDVNGRGNYIDPTDKDYTKPSRYTYLGYAVLAGSAKSADKLLELGADANLISADASGALRANVNMASENDNKDMIRLLVRYKENLNPELTNSPIDDLLMGEVDKEMIDFLLANGANINHQEYIGGEGLLNRLYKLKNSIT